MCQVRENGKDARQLELGIPETKRFVPFQKGGIWWISEPISCVSAHYGVLLKEKEVKPSKKPSRLLLSAMDRLCHKKCNKNKIFGHTRCGSELLINIPYVSQIVLRAFN